MFQYKFHTHECQLNYKLWLENVIPQNGFTGNSIFQTYIWMDHLIKCPLWLNPPPFWSWFIQFVSWMQINIALSMMSMLTAKVDPAPFEFTVARPHRQRGSQTGVNNQYITIRKINECMKNYYDRARELLRSFPIRNFLFKLGFLSIGHLENPPTWECYFWEYPTEKASPRNTRRAFLLAIAIGLPSRPGLLLVDVRM